MIRIINSGFNHAHYGCVIWLPTSVAGCTLFSGTVNEINGLSNESVKETSPISNSKAEPEENSEDL